MILEELLEKAKTVIDNGGSDDDVYDLLTDRSNEKYPLAKYDDLNYSCPSDIDKKEVRRQSKLKRNEIEGIIACVRDYIEENFENVKIKTDPGNPFMTCRDTIKLHMKNHFFSVTYCPNVSNDVSQDTEIKLYFNIDFENIGDFFKEYAYFAVENSMYTYFKTRYANATDMVTVRFYDNSKLDEIISIINKYKKNDKVNPLIETYNGIGYTLDTGESFNRELSKLIFKYVSNTDSVTKDGFREFVRDQYSDVVEPSFKFNSREENTRYMFKRNLDSFIEDKEFTVDQFKDKANEVISLEKNTKLERKLKIEFFDNLMKELIEIGCSDSDKMLEEVENIFKENNSVNINGKNIKTIDIIKEKYADGDAKSEFRNYCIKKLGYVKKEAIKKVKRFSAIFTSGVIAELSKIGYTDNEDMMKKVSSVVDNTQVIYKDFTIGDIIKYSMIPYCKEGNTKEALYNLCMNMIDTTNGVYDYINSLKKPERSRDDIEEMIYEYEDEFNTDIKDGSLDIYEIVLNLLQYKYKFEYKNDRVMTITSILEGIK